MRATCKLLCFASLAFACEALARFGRQRRAFLGVVSRARLLARALCYEAIYRFAVVLEPSLWVAVRDEEPGANELRNALLRDTSQRCPHFPGRVPASH